MQKLTSREPQADFLELINSYWNQVEAQVSKLEAMLDNVDKVYHELITLGGEKGMKVIKELNSGSYQIANTRVKKGAAQGKLKGLSFCITGTLSRPRDEIKAEILRAGGKWSPSVSKKTDYLVAGENVGATKRKSAEKNNVKVIDETALETMLR